MKKSGYFRLLALAFVIMTGIALLTRTALLIKSLPNLDLTLLLLAKIYLVGLFFDCVTFSYALIPFVLLAVLTPNRLANSAFGRFLAQAGLFLFIFVLLFTGVAEYVFFDEFATRFNFIAVDYLLYTTEVVKNIHESYPVGLIVGLLLLLTIGPFLPARRRLQAIYPLKTKLRRRAGVGALLLLLPLVSFFGVWISLTEISPNSYANELAANGIYGFFAALRNNELEYGKFYVVRDEKTILTRLGRMVHSDGKGVAREARGSGRERKLNIILVCEESLSAEYLAAFGSTKGLTPNLDRLARESLFFTHLYATGTRTVRGLEALTLSIPPLPGTAIVKRPGNEGFQSIGAILKQRGYDNRFIYGGRGYFDNMNYFFAKNGFTTIDQTDFAKEEIHFKNAWGVCDEDLFDKAIQQAGISSRAGKPFFSFLMTTSNHRPYTFPAGKIDIPSGSGRDGAVKYSDYAIGQLIAKAKKEPWFKDTVFVIVADHCAGVARKLAMPVKSYEIPLLIYAPGLIAPKTVDRMMSQIDIPPTLLGLLNLNYQSKFFGRDIFREPDGPERAFIATYQTLGYIEDDKLLVLNPARRSEFFRFNRANGATTPIPKDGEMLLNGLAYYQGSALVYKKRLNRAKP